MAKHQTQHKAAREERKSKELADLKRENQSLKRKISKLQTYTKKLLEMVQFAPEEEAVLAIATEAVKLDACGGCGNKNLTHVSLPTGTMIACKQCGWRKKNV